MSIRRLSVLAALALSFLAAPGANAVSSIFRDLAPTSLPTRGGTGALEIALPAAFRPLAVDVPALDRALAGAPDERSSGTPLILALPYPDGSERRFQVVESSIMEPALQAKFPELRTYVAQGLDDPTATARLSLTPMGFHAMVLSVEGTLFIDPYRRWDASVVLSYWKRDARRVAGSKFHCEVEEAMSELAPELAQAPEASSGTNLRTYRLALAGTAEYTAAVCAPNPAAVSCGLAAMVVSMNRVNGVYEREVAIRMVMVAANNLVVYTANPDPYTNGNGSTMLGENQSNLNIVIGTANYDIGHVFSTGGGGVAQLNVPCTASKARGVTGRGFPVGDPFDIDYVAHEMGHQWGGQHTFNGTTSSCGGGNRSAGSAYEPGSGSTIMAYAGICGAEDLQPNSDDTFHTRSFDQIVTFSTGVTGSSCAVITATGNTPPTVSAGAAFTIPRQTPFTLTGSATDPNPDTLTYMWEEFDLGTASPPNDDVAASRPIFRSFVPLAIPSRTFPKLSDILNNTATFGESMSTRNRTMTFRLMVRDNRAAGGGVDYASTTVTVNAASGPFVVTQPDTALSWIGGTSQTVTWNVANTTAAPVSCANVAIELSTDGGNNFTAVLAASTANDGSESVSIPNTPSTTARVRVTCVGNVFFDISNTDFTITAGSADPAPDLISILPTSGPTAGGTAVALTGTDFVNGATVSFGGTASGSVTFNNSTSLTATAPAHVAGAVAVQVTNPDTQSDSLAGAYTYLAPGYFTLTPCRLVDTRDPNGPTGGPALVNGSIRTFPALGLCGVPASAKAITINVTIVSPTGAGDLNLFASGITPPQTSVINFTAGSTRANNAMVRVDGPLVGSLDVLPAVSGGGTVHFILDVTGYFE